MKKKICVIGAGRIGLPLSLVIADSGYRVTIIDKDESYIKRLLRKKPPFYEPQLLEFMEKHIGSSVYPTTDLGEGVNSSDIVLVAVGTGITDINKPDLSNLWSLIEELSAFSLKNKLLVIKTTLPLGTTQKINEFLERKTGLKCEIDLFVAYCPERIVEGQALEEFRQLPKIVGGIGPKSSEMAAKFMESIGTGKAIEVENTVAAEFVKLIDNSYRVLRFGYANDISHIAELFGLDIYSLLDAANEGYKRNDIPYPSCGVGGYCLTKDPYYLECSFEETAKKRGFASVWYYARESNHYQTEHTANQIVNVLKRHQTSVEKPEVLICGITYKENVDDIRDSHGLMLAKKLKEQKVGVTVWDPWIRERDINYPVYGNPDVAFKNKDVAVFTIAHNEFKELARNGKIKKLVNTMRNRIIFDGWGIFRTVDFDDSVIHFGTGLPKFNERGRSNAK